MRGWIVAPLTLILVSLLLWVAAFVVHGAELFAKPPYVFLGLDKPFNGTWTCVREADPDISANAGFGANLMASHLWELNAQYTHHSCAADIDMDTYDGVGLQLRWFPTLWGRPWPKSPP